MNALEALNKLTALDSRIDALNIAYDVLWSEFDKRLYAISLKELKEELESERLVLADKLQSVNL